MKNKLLKLENEMELFLLPLPIQNDDKISYYKLSKQVYIGNLGTIVKYGKYFFKNDSLFDETAYNSLKNYYWKNRMENDKVDGFSFMDRYYSYVLYNNELKIIHFGRKIKDKIDVEEKIYDGFYYFKKLIIKIEKLIGYANYDNTYFTDKYYNLYDKSDLIFDKIKQDNTLDEYLKKNSYSKNQNEILKLFQTLGLMDLNAYIRRKKLEKLINQNIIKGIPPTIEEIKNEAERLRKDEDFISGCNYVLKFIKKQKI